MLLVASFSVAYLIWSCLILATGCSSPLYVVLTHSMEPGYQRGDLLVLSNRTDMSTGDIVLFIEH